jgi:hypothetical protein
MPAFDHGAVTIVVCPDAEPAASAMGGHHHHNPKKLHQPCPYASASSLGALTVDFVGIAVLLAVSLRLLLGRASVFVEHHRTRDRPPSRGPPIPA